MRIAYRLGLEIGFFFGWLLAVPLFGPLLMSAGSNQMGQGVHADPQIFVLTHALSLVLMGIALSRWPYQQPWLSHLIRGSVGLCALITVMLFWSGPSKHGILLALMAIPASLYILLWVHRFAGLAPQLRSRTMALGMIVANIIYGSSLLIDSQFDLLSITALAAGLLIFPALWLQLPSGDKPEVNKELLPEMGSLPLARFCLAVFAFYVVGGLYYAVMLSSIQTSSLWRETYQVAPYILALAGSLLVIERLGLRTLAIISATVLGIGYGLFALIPANGGNMIAFSMILAALAGFDMFVWLGLAELSIKRMNAVSTYGWGLGANVAGLLAGSYMAVRWLSLIPQDIIYSSALTAAMVLFVSILGLVDFPTSSEHESVENRSNRIITLPSNLAPLLTARQLEVANLILRGLDNKAIESELFISANTTKSHIRHIYRRLNIHSRQDLLLLALKEPEEGTSPALEVG